jgi:hypothetical protein
MCKAWKTFMTTWEVLETMLVTIGENVTPKLFRAILKEAGLEKTTEDIVSALEKMGIFKDEEINHG